MSVSETRRGGSRNPSAVRRARLRSVGLGAILLPVVAAIAPVTRPCPVPICQYEGTAWAEDRTGEGSTELTVRGDARVRWTFLRMDGREALYVPSGELTAKWTTPQCTVRLTPATHEFPASVSHGTLRVDFTRNPVTYQGGGASEWGGSQRWACTTGDPFEITGDAETGVLAAWFTGEGVSSEGGTILKGSSVTDTRRSEWMFSAVPDTRR